LGHRLRAIIIMVVIAITFWTGVAIGGVKSTIDPQENRIWFLAQVCTGGHSILATLWSTRLEPVTYRCPKCGAELIGRPQEDTSCAKCGVHVTPASVKTTNRIAFWPQVDIAVVYTGIAGLLNLLVILDAIARAELEPLEGARKKKAVTAHG
jgi:predicted RNA-binding Zn-ribbon protein involved in translation (DUF1610 family)